MRAREGDYIETREGLFFDVKGLVHPPDRVIAFPRYFPDADGDRAKNGVPYRKVYPLVERFALLKKRFPQYLVYDEVFDETLCEVPHSDIACHYSPVEKLPSLRESEDVDAVETEALQCAEQLKTAAGIPWNAVGVSGSVMVGLHTEKSDIDLVIYGSVQCRRAYAALKGLLKDGDGLFKPYTEEQLKGLFDFRSKDTNVSFEDFVRTEARKASQGKFAERDYFIRFVKDWNEVDEKYGDVRYKNVGYAKIEATVADDLEAIFTPCVYGIESVKTLENLHVEPIVEIVSFRGRFCEQASKGEKVIAHGKVELVTDQKQDKRRFRLLIGNKASDYLIPVGSPEPFP